LKNPINAKFLLTAPKKPGDFMAYLPEESKYGPFPCESKPKVNAGKTKASLNKRK
jgi:hypothetical protein